MSPILQNRSRPSRICSVAGCGGTMTFRARQEVGAAETEGSSGGTWVCDSNPTHTEGVSPAEEQDISGR